MTLQNCAVIINLRSRSAVNPVNFITHTIHFGLCRNNRDVQIEPRNLLFAQIIEAHTHNLRNIWASVQICRLIRHNQVLSRDKLTYCTAQSLVIVDLLERATRQWQIKQHLVHVRGVIFHHIRDVEIHKMPYALGLGLFFSCFRPHNSSSHRPT